MMSAIVTLTSHLKEQSRASFRINGEERRFPSQLAEDQKNKVSGSTPRCLYRRGEPKWPFESHVWDSEWHAWSLDFFTIQVVQRPVHCEWGPSPHVNNVNPTGVARQQGR
jgi:hypothetical protein